MRIRCSRCGATVSPELPEGSTIRAWVECPECCANGPDFDKDILHDDFAGRALEGILSNVQRFVPDGQQGKKARDNIVDQAYSVADAMMEEREARRGPN